jgi:mannose-1-phosphate guanylyltransferase
MGRSGRIARRLEQCIPSGDDSSSHRASRAPERNPSTWAIVLAGGEGLRLRPLVRQIVGADRPKQYVPLFGQRSLLRQTLDRVSLVIARERTVVVTASHHVRYVNEEFAARPRPTVLAQPLDRGTAAGALYPAHWIAWHDPEAIVALFPSDHLIADDAALMAHVTEVIAWIDTHPEHMVLLGAPPTYPEIEYGWIEPGIPLGELSTGAVRTVRRFTEKPSLPQARICLEAGHFWNTSIIVARVATLVRAGRRTVPVLSEHLSRIERYVGTPQETTAVRHAYDLVPTQNFSRSVLEGCADMLAVSCMPHTTWCDLGSPDRVMDAVARMRTCPEWAARLLPNAPEHSRLDERVVAP